MPIDLILLLYPQAIKLAMIAARGDTNLAMDIAHDVMLAVWKRQERGELPVPDRMQAYVMQCCKNLSYDIRQAAARHEALPETHDLPDPDPRIDPLYWVLSRERTWEIHQALAAIGAEQSRTLQFHYLEGLSCAEIATIEKTTEGAIKVRLHRARAALRKVLG